MAVVVIAGRKGGIGKSTIVGNLAAEFIARRRAVVALDADPQHSLAAWAEQGEGVLSKCVQKVGTSVHDDLRAKVRAAQRTAVRRVLSKIAESEPEARPGALAELTILARLRNLVPLLEKETERMPILEDIMEHEIIGRERKRGMAIGREEGREEGERALILRLIEKRFGTVPAPSRARIESMKAPELATLADRLFKAESLAELLG